MDCRNARLLLEFARPQGAELEASDALTLESHLAECPECLSQAKLEHQLEKPLQKAMLAVQIPENLRTRLLSRLASERDAWYRGWLMRSVGVLAAAAALVLLIWGGKIWFDSRRADLDTDEIVSHFAPGANSPEAVEAWFQDNYSLRVLAPSRTMVHYQRLTSLDLVEFPGTGKRVPMLFFSYNGHNEEAVARVFVVTDKDFKNLKELANQPPKGSKGVKVKVVTNQDHPQVFYVVMYTEGKEQLFFPDTRPAT